MFLKVSFQLQLLSNYFLHFGKTITADNDIPIFNHKHIGYTVQIH